METLETVHVVLFLPLTKAFSTVNYGVPGPKASGVHLVQTIQMISEIGANYFNQTEFLIKFHCGRTVRRTKRLNKAVS